MALKKQEKQLNCEIKKTLEQCRNKSCFVRVILCCNMLKIYRKSLWILDIRKPCFT